MADDQPAAVTSLIIDAPVVALQSDADFVDVVLTAIATNAILLEALHSFVANGFEKQDRS